MNIINITKIITYKNFLKPIKNKKIHNKTSILKNNK